MMACSPKSKLNLPLASVIDQRGSGDIRLPLILLLSLLLLACGGGTPPAEPTQPAQDQSAGPVLSVRVSENINVQTDTAVTLGAEVLHQGLVTKQALVEWRQLSGSGEAVFSAADSLQTEVSFDTAGVYVLRMSAVLGDLSRADTLVATVTEATVNQAPVVDAGEDLQTVLGESLQLRGRVSDDDLPMASLEIRWSQTSADGEASFGEISDLNSSVSFSHSGSYVLQLHADDGELQSSDQLVITVTTAAAADDAGSGNFTNSNADVNADANADWQRVSSADGSKPQARHEAGGVQFENNFYLLGGRGIRQVDRYDPSSNRWQNLGTAATVMNHFQPVVWAGKIYVVGALDCCYPAENVIDRIQIFDPVSGKWSQGATLPANRRRGSAGTVVYNGKIYLIGGTTNGHDGGQVNWFDEYNPATNSWKTLPSAPTRRDHFQAAVAGNRLVAAGGRQTDYPDTFGNLVARVDVYNFDTGKWETNAPNLSLPRAGTVAVSYGREVIIIGGETALAGVASKRVDAYNVDTRKWRRLDDLNESRHGGGAAVIGDQLHVASGSNNRGGGPETQGHEKLLLSPDPG